MPSQKRDYANILIVEGVDDKHSVIGLMKHHTYWPEERGPWPVWVEVGNSADEILKAGYPTTEIKASNARTVGVMLDADTHMAGRYERIRQLCDALFPSLPREVPQSGLVTENDEKRFGVWIMPDNTSQGDLETFLRHLVPNAEEHLWQLACDSVAAAASSGAKGKLRNNMDNYYRRITVAEARSCSSTRDGLCGVGSGPLPVARR